MNKQDLASNNQQCLKCHKTQANKQSKVEGAVNYSTVTRLYKTFYSDCKNLNNQSQVGLKLWIEDMLQAIEAYLVSST